MSKAVLISVRPEWCAKILSGEKTIEIRKTRPKLEPPFKCYIYGTKGKKNADGRYRHYYWYRKDNIPRSFEGGKVIGEFVCDAIYPISFYASDSSFFDNAPPLSVPGTCLTDREIAEYLGNGKTGYGWHISDLKIYDVPLTLDAFMKQPCDFAASCGCCSHVRWIGTSHTFGHCECEFSVTRAPQSWCYVEEIEKKNEK